MSITVSNTANSQTFGTIQTRFNQLAVLFSQNTLTVDSSTTGSLSTGNAYVNGIIGTLTLTANTLSGGTLTTPANLTITTNSIFQSSFSNVLGIYSNSTISNVIFYTNNIVIANGATVTGNLTFANSTVFTNATVNNYFANNVTANALYIGITTVNTTVLAVGANIVVNASTVVIGNSTVNTTVNSTSFFAGNSTVYGYGNSTTDGLVSAIGNLTLSATGISLQGGIALGNVTVNGSTAFFGNSTVNATVNSSVYSGQALTANNSTNFGGQLPTYYANVTAPAFSTSVNVGSNVSLGTAGLTVGNSTVNATVNSTIFTGQALTSNNSTNFAGQAQAFYANVSNPNFSGSVNVGANVSLNTSTLTIGNNTVNATVNSTIFTGQSLTSNNSTNFNGQPASFYANVTAPIFSTSVNVGANVSLGTATLSIGNSTVNNIINSTAIAIGTAIVNSTTFTGTSNNSSYFNGQLPAYYANVTSPSFSTSVKVGANVTLGTVSLSLGNSTVNSVINSTAILIGATVVNSSVFTGQAWTANNSSYFNGQTAAYYANVSAPVFTTSVNVGSNVSLGAASLVIGNSTVNSTVNSTIFTGLSWSANNSTYFNGQTAAYYANVSNPNFSGSVNVGSNVSLTTSVLSIGNSTVNAVLNSTSISIGATVVNSTVFTGQSLTSNNATNFAGQGQAFYANVSNPNFSGSVNVGSNVSLTTVGWSIGNSTVNISSNSTLSTLAAINTNGLINSTSAAIFSGIDNGGAGGQARLISGNYGLILRNDGTNFQILVTASANQYGTWSALRPLTYVIGGNLNLDSTGSALVTVGNSLFVNNTLTVGNTTVNSTLSATNLTIGNSSVNSSNFSVGSNVDINLTNVVVSNSTVNTTVSNDGIYIVGGVNASNVSFTATGILLGNSTVNATVNSTVFTGQALTSNNATNFAGQGQAFYANVTSPIFTTSVNVGANVNLTTSVLAIGNTTVNTTVNSTHFFAGNTTVYGYGNSTADGLVGPSGNITITPVNLYFLGGVTSGNVTVNSSLLFIGNSTVNATVNSTVYTGQSLTANNSTNFGGQLPAYYANVTAPVFATSVNVGSNVNLTTSILTIGNTTVNTTVNSTHFFAGNTTVYGYGNSTADGLVGPSGNLSMTPTTITLFGGITGGNVSINNTNIFVGNSTVNAVMNSSSFSVGGVTVNSSGATNLGNITANSITLSRTNGPIINVSVNGGSAITAFSNTAAAAYFSSNGGLNIFIVGNTTANTFIINGNGSVVVSARQIGDVGFTSVNQTHIIDANLIPTVTRNSIAHIITFRNHSLYQNSTGGQITGSVLASISTPVNNGLNDDGVTPESAWMDSFYGLNFGYNNYSTYVGNAVNAVYGTRNVITNFSNTSNIGIAYGVYNSFHTSDANTVGSINKVYATYNVIGIASSNSVISNAYGLYIQMIPANITNSYGIYSTGENQNFLSNTLTIGSNVVISTSTLSIGNATVNTVVNSSAMTIAGIPLGLAGGFNNLYSFTLASYGTNTAPGATVSGASLTVYNANSTISRTLSGTWTFLGSPTASSNVGLWVRSA